jgi:hypothetical protein
VSGFRSFLVNKSRLSHTNRRELWRADAKLDSILQNCREEVRKAERILATAVDKVGSLLLSLQLRVTMMS